MSRSEVVAVVASLRYKPGWSFTYRQRADGDRLDVRAITPDSWHPESLRTTGHSWPVPPVADVREFVRWVHARLLDAEAHECAEFLVVDGFRPFFPNHATGDPYEAVERWELA